jgi:hypothetical protein
MNRPLHSWTTKQLKRLQELYRERPLKACVEILNREFGLELTFGQVRAATKNHKIRSGRTGRIEKGHVPWNKGKPFDCPGREATQFKKGQMPHNYHPVGTEIVRTDGYLQVKVADPKTWKLKHHLVWEEANGPIPKGHMIVFLNQDKTDTRLENLKLVKRSLMAIANKNGLIREDAEHTKTGLLIAEVKQAAFRAKKNKKKPASYETMYRDDFSAGKGLLDEELS